MVTKKMMIDVLLKSKMMNPNRVIKFLEIYYVLYKYKPKTVVEYGYGLSSYIFDEVVHSNLMTIEEDEKWVKFYGDKMGYVPLHLHVYPKMIMDYDGVRTCCYKMSHDILADMVYVDAPTNKDEETGKYLPCVDVLLMGFCPDIIMVHGRKTTVDFIRGKMHGYRIIKLRQHTLFKKFERKIEKNENILRETEGDNGVVYHMRRGDVRL